MTHDELLIKIERAIERDPARALEETVQLLAASIPRYTWVGIYVRFPQYRARAGSTQLIEDRINDCFVRSMNGRPLATESRDMRDIVAYMAFLSSGYPQFAQVEGLDAPLWTIAAGEAKFEALITNLPDDVRTFGDAQLLERWQQAGGRYEITSFKGGDSMGAFDITGSIGLDPAGRPEGQIKLHSNGIVERLGRAVCGCAPGSSPSRTTASSGASRTRSS